jgi:hypothetical protein
MNGLVVDRLGVKLQLAVAVTSLVLVVGVARAVTIPQASRSFEFPVMFANGLTADLVVPAGSTTNLRFETGKVAVGELPVPLPEGAHRRRRRSAREFVRPADIGSHARLLLTGVIDGDGHPITNTGNQVVIDAVVSPSSAASAAPPFVLPFDITNGRAFVEALLPIQPTADGGARVQVLGVTVVDPDGQPFGVLGFQLPPPRPTPVGRPTPKPGEPRPGDGQCFVGAECTGVSFRSTRERCCRLAGGLDGAPAAASWCPADQFDASTGQCVANVCVACAPAPPKETPTPGPCDNGATCGGACLAECADGTASPGECAPDRMNHCTCSAQCGSPTPCGAGQCFDTRAFRCTGQPCSANRRCPLPNQFCDLSGNRCPCASPPPPHGRVCCQCKAGPRACFDFSFTDVQPLCPAGCETYVGRECDASSDSCLPLTFCQTDADCNDGNGCTIDRCSADGCTHDCVCVGPMGCGPGPGRAPQP